MSFTRRPVLEGETAVPVFTQPSIRGCIAKDATTGAVTAMVVPCDLLIETDTMGGMPVAVMLASNLMADIVVAVNAALSAGPWGTAEEREGCLQIYTNGTGEGSFIRIGQSTNDYDFDGVNDDAAPALGLPRSPDPTATVRSGDLAASPVRARDQGNPQGTAFVAAGEDRVASAYNRALSRVSRNMDHLYTLLAASVATPLVIDVHQSDPAWAGRLIYDGNGQLAQVDLSDLGVINAGWAGRLYVGQLSNTSKLSDIAKHWTVTDQTGRELLVWEEAAASEKRRPLRISAVTRGQMLGVAPTFADEYSAPAGALANTVANAPDGLNALGVNRIKIAGANISSIRNRTVVICDALMPGADFTWANVVVGDLAIITGATVTDPFNHNGSYLVEEVINGRELILRPLSTDDLDALNPDDSGAYGSLAIRSSGHWENDIFVVLDPPLPRFPDDGVLRFVVGVEAELGQMLEATLLKSMVKASEEVDDFVIRQLWHKQTIGGTYDGMKEGSAGGAFADVRRRPITMANTQPQLPSAGTIVRGPFVSEIMAGNILRAASGAVPPHPDSFTLNDVGRTVRISGGGGTYRDSEICTIEEVIDGEHARLVPPTNRMNAALPIAVNVTYAIYQNSVHDLPAAQVVVAPDNTGTGPAQNIGTAFIRENIDDGGVTLPLTGSGFLHVERVKITYEGANVNRMDVNVTAYAGGNTLDIAFNPEATSNIYSEDGGTTRLIPGYQVGTLVRVLNGPRAGWYRLKSTNAANNRLTLLNLNGAVPAAFVNPLIQVKVAFYNVTFGTNIILKGQPSAGAAVVAGAYAHYDSKEHGDAYGAGLCASWRGPGAAIFGAVNDPSWLALDSGDGAIGFFTDVVCYGPAGGFSYYVEAPNSGSDARRAAKGGVVHTKTYSLDLALVADAEAIGNHNSATPQLGWSQWIHQNGRDPGLVVVKSETLNVGDAYGYPSAAAVVIRYDGITSGIWSGIDMTGSIYVRSIVGGYGSNAGIYSESGVASAYWMHPMHPYYLTPSTGTDYYTTSLADVFVTELGAAGQVFPRYTADAPVAATTKAPDFSVFNLPHHGLIEVNNATLAVLTATGAARYIGKTIKVAGTVDRNSTFTIVAAHGDVGTNITQFAIEDAEANPVWAGNQASTQINVYGKRWHRGHVDVGDWAQIGTNFYGANAWESPVVTTGPRLEDTMGRVAAAGAGTLVKATEGGLSAQQYYPNADGTGIGEFFELASFPNLNVTAVAFAAASSWPTNTTWRDGWTQDSHQPRSPFPNSGVISPNNSSSSSNDVNQLTATVPGTLAVDDVALQHVTMNTVNGVVLTWFGEYGGCLAVYTNANAVLGLTDTVRVWLRGTRGLPTVLYALRAKVVVSWLSNAAHAVVLALRDDDGNVIATHNVTVTINDDKPREIEYEFTYIDIYKQPSDFIDSHSLHTKGVHFTVDLPVMDSETNLTPLFILHMGLEQISKPHRLIGNHDIHGVVRAHAYRHISPVRGFQTVTPLEVDLLQNTEYARLYGQTSIVFGGGQRMYGIQEGKDVGLIDTNGAGNWVRPTFQREMFFRKGAHSASITGYHPFFDPFFYVYATQNAGNVIEGSFVLPGRTGFVVPLDPPHGSRITSLHYGLSFLPHMTPDIIAPVANFQVWRGRGALDVSGSTLGQWSTKATWDAQEGVVVRLFRYNTLDFGTDQENVSTTGYTAEFGYAEQIWTYDLDLSAVVEPTFNSNPASVSADGGAGDFISTEKFVKRGHALPDEIAGNAADLMVDRRHYGYFMTIEFYMGGRNIAGGAYTYDNWEYFIRPNAYALAAGPANIEGVLVPYDLTDTTHHWPATVKFRGARLGWVTDRAGSGGWG